MKRKQKSVGDGDEEHKDSCRGGCSYDTYMEEDMYIMLRIQEIPFGRPLAFDMLPVSRGSVLPYIQSGRYDEYYYTYSGDGGKAPLFKIYLFGEEDETLVCVNVRHIPTLDQQILIIKRKIKRNKIKYKHRHRHPNNKYGKRRTIKTKPKTKQKKKHQKSYFSSSSVCVGGEEDTPRVVVIGKALMFFFFPFILVLICLSVLLAEEYEYENN
eukprot:gene1181-697_t